MTSTTSSTSAFIHSSIFLVIHVNVEETSSVKLFSVHFPKAPIYFLILAENFPHFCDLSYVAQFKLKNECAWLKFYDWPIHMG